RPGTEPVHLAVGMAKALELAIRDLKTAWTHVESLRNTLLYHLRESAGPVMVNSPEEGGLPHVLNVSFPGCAAEVLLMKLDLAGVACSTGSACSSGSLLPSPVLKAMGIQEPRLSSAMRFSFSHITRAAEAEDAANRIIKAVKELRTAVGEV